MIKYLFSFFKQKQESTTFWEHVDDLRKYLFRSVLAIVSLSIVAFFYKDFIFNTLILSPSKIDFITYRALCKFGTFAHIDGLCFQPFKLTLVNIELGGQFRYHILISVITGIIVAFPFIAWQLWLFVKPALKESEMKYTRGLVFYISVLFLIGVLFGYFVITPLTVNFLVTYQLSAEIVNTITIGSYISNVSVLSLSMGLVFEMPVLIYFLTKIGMISSQFLRSYRRHAIVVLFILAGFITPSTDMFSQTLVALPLLMLFEVSIFISKKTESN
ncbi:MAG: twin-arginine translocase subunit TatC [Bacteroidota bacterium]